jgi:formylglycine-generating enzyme required for sulfatase activity
VATEPSIASDRIELQDGTVLTGDLKTEKTGFDSSFGSVDVALGDVRRFEAETLHLSDGSLLKGRFADGSLEILTARGSFSVPAQDIVRIIRSGAVAPTPTTDVASGPDAGQGILSGRVLDNFGQPVVGATVRVAGTNLTSQTAADGSYQMSYVPGTFVVRIEGPGYDPTEFPLQLAQASAMPVEDKMLVKAPPGSEVYLWGDTDWIALGRCSVAQTEKDARDFDRGGTSRYAAVGNAAVVNAQGPAAFLDATGKRSGLLLYPVETDGTIVRIVRKGGFPGVFGELRNEGAAGGAIDMERRMLGPGRPVYEAVLPPGVYAFVQHPGNIANVVYPADVCFKFEIKSAGQVLREQAEQEAGQLETGVGTRIVAAGVLSPGDGQTEALLNLDRDQRRQVQAWLNALGFNAGKPDGLFGSGTRGGIAAYQRAAGVTESGYLSDSQYQHLRTQGGRALAAQTVRTIAANLVPVPAGCFQMGSPPSETGREDDEGPQHRVCLKPFKLSRFEVTVRDFRAFVAANSYRTDAERNAGGKMGCLALDLDRNPQWADSAWASWQRPNRHQDNRDDHPVSCVSWNDAKAYIAWLNEVGGGGYRLPTEAEWEFAARAGTTTARFWGEDSGGACRYENVSAQTQFRWRGSAFSYTNPHACSDGHHWVAPVGSYRANPWGLYDMLGNVYEWTEDCFNESYASAPEDGAAWISDDCRTRSLRGGAWNDYPPAVRSAKRYDPPPDYRSSKTGFRLAGD